MKKRITLHFVGSYAISKEHLWNLINTFPKMNKEFFPILIMTYPKRYKKTTFEEYPMNNYAFTSIILLLGFIPIEIYKARLLEVVSNTSFSEDSKSLFTSSWKHKRTLEEKDNVCIVNDNLDISLRNVLMYPFFRMFLNIVFKRRHKNLMKIITKINGT